MNDHKETLKKDGVCILKNAFTHNDINILLNKFNNLLDKSKKILQDTVGKKVEYITYFDKEVVHEKILYEDKNINILELNQGRYDIYPKNNHIDLKENIKNLLSCFIKKNFIVNWGILTSNINSKNGDWHRDTLNLDGDSNEDGTYNDYHTVNMNPFYFTILIPLVPLNKLNGSTEFIKGSHRLTFNNINNSEHIQFDTDLGDAIIFDGRIFHRGRENLSNKTRPIIYIIVHRDWYTESY